MTLVALNDMRIKFPGKSDEEAEYILDKVNMSKGPFRIYDLGWVEVLTRMTRQKLMPP